MESKDKLDLRWHGESWRGLKDEQQDRYPPTSPLLQRFRARLFEWTRMHIVYTEAEPVFTKAKIRLRFSYASASAKLLFFSS
jgi:hypothetical protein